MIYESKKEATYVFTESSDDVVHFMDLYQNAAILGSWLIDKNLS